MDYVEIAFFETVYCAKIGPCETLNGRLYVIADHFLDTKLYFLNDLKIFVGRGLVFGWPHWFVLYVCLKFGRLPFFVHLN